MKLATWNSLALVFLILAPAFVWGAKPGSSTANFLKIGVGGRAAAMGEAQTAAVNDATASYWNPAALADLWMQEIVVMHEELFESTRYEYLAYARPTRTKGTFAGSLAMVNVGDIQGYDTAGTKTQVLTASDMLLGGHWGRKKSFLRGGSISYGASGKFLRKKLGEDSAQGFMADGGVLWRPRGERLRNLQLALAVQNVGPGLKFKSESSPLPRTIKVGAAYSLFGDNMVVAMDLLSPNDRAFTANMGLEYRLLDRLALRAGYHGQQDAGTKITFGFGVGNKTLRFDYAFNGFGDLGNTHRISFGIRFGRNLRTAQLDEAIDERYRIAARHKAQGYFLDSYMELLQLSQAAPWYTPAKDLMKKMEDEVKEVKDVQVQRLLEEQIAKHVKAGREFLERDDLVNARNEFQAILALKPDHEEAKQYLKKVDDRYKSVSDTFFKAGQAAFNEGRYLDAQEAYNRVLLLNPKHEQAAKELTRVTVLIEEAERAKQAKAKSEIIQKSYARGMEYIQTGNWEQAYLSFQSVIKLEPKHAESRARLEEVRSHMFDLYYGEGMEFYKQGRLVNSVESLKKALTFDPYSVAAKNALDKAEERLAHYKLTKSQSLYTQGLEAFQAGEKEKALEMWQKAVELNPENMEAKRGLERLGK